MLEHYPLRGVATGSIMLLEYHFFGDSWRKAHLAFLWTIEIISMAVLTVGISIFFGSYLMLPLMMFLCAKYQWTISESVFFMAEGITRSLIPLIAGLVFLLCAKQPRIRFGMKWELSIFAGLFFTTQLLMHVKTQFLVGLLTLVGLFAFSKETRRPCLWLSGVCLSMALSVLSVNYFAYHGNTEVFASSALQWTYNSKIGKEALEIGCVQKVYAPEVREKICVADRPAKASWHWLATRITQYPLFLDFVRQLSAINKKVVASYWKVHIRTLVQKADEIVEMLYGAKYYEYDGIKRAIFVLFALALLPWGMKVVSLGVILFVVLPVWLPTIIMMDFHILGQARYFHPVRLLILALPYAFLWGTLLYLSARMDWKVILGRVSKWWKTTPYRRTD